MKQKDPLTGYDNNTFSVRLAAASKPPWSASAQSRGDAHAQAAARYFAARELFEKSNKASKAKATPAEKAAANGDHRLPAGSGRSAG
jgi:hypothetical protein